ncbi:hypothetical protein GCM10029963_70930 [Micromonospora andamanensis]
MQDREALDHLHQVARARLGEQLGVDRDPAGFVPRQAVGDHAADPTHLTSVGCDATAPPDGHASRARRAA